MTRASSTTRGRGQGTRGRGRDSTQNNRGTSRSRGTGRGTGRGRGQATGKRGRGRPKGSKNISPRKTAVPTPSATRFNPENYGMSSDAIELPEVSATEGEINSDFVSDCSTVIGAIRTAFPPGALEAIVVEMNEQRELRCTERCVRQIARSESSTPARSRASTTSVTPPRIFPQKRQPSFSNSHPSKSTTGRPCS